MHTLNVLLEVVKPRPDFLGILATSGSTFEAPRFIKDELMHTFLVSIEVIHSTKAGTAIAALDLAPVRFVMLEHVFSFEDSISISSIKPS